MSILNAVSASLQHALLLGLLPHERPAYRLVKNKDYGPGKPTMVREETEGTVQTRPREDECDVFAFPQTWGSTALGFGGAGGQAFTQAPTVVVIGPLNDACVYFRGALAYHVLRPNDQFRVDMTNFTMASVVQSHTKYETFSAPVQPPAPRA